MAKVEVSEGFVEDMTQAYMDSKREEIWYAVSLLEFAPEMGSRILPTSIKRRFGDTVRKVVVDPFDIIYRYFAEQDLVYVVGLVHQRAAHNR